MQIKRVIPALLLLAMLLAGCGKSAQTSAPQLQEPVGVLPDTATAYIGEIYDIVFFDSKVVPAVQELCFEVDGTIAAVHFYPGMEVEAGDVLAELDQSAIRNRVQQLEETLAHEEKTNGYTDSLALLDIQMLQAELRQLQAQGGSERDIALKKNEIAQKEATLRQTQAMRELEQREKREELEQLHASLGNNMLYAPFSGRIVSMDELAVGSWVKANDPVAFLADDTKLHLSGTYIKDSQLTRADRVYAHIGADQYEIVLRPMDQQEYVAAVLAGKTVYTEFDILGPEDLLSQVQAGQYAAICIVSNYVENALLIPSGAVLRDGTGSYVYVAENGARVRRAVKTGESNESLVQILEGLEEGEVVYVK